MITVLMVSNGNDYKFSILKLIKQFEKQNCIYERWQIGLYLLKECGDRCRRRY